MSFIEVGAAGVRIEADSGDAEREITGFLRDIERVTLRTAEVIEAGFDSMADAIEDAAESIRDDFAREFNLLRATAEQAGESIQSSFVEAARQSDAALNDIGGLNAYAGAVLEAELAGEAIEAVFNQTQQEVDDQLQQIGGPEVWGPLVAEATATGVAINGAFSGISLGSVLGPIGSLAGLLGGAAAATTAAGGAITLFGLDQAASMEQLRVAFEGLLGDAGAAQRVLEQLRDFAANTPFELQGLTENARNLLAMSDASGVTVDNLIPTLTTIGNLGSLLGATPAEFDRVIRAFSQMDAKGKVSREELLQLTEAFPGFPVFQELAEGLGVSTEELDKLLTDGAIPATDGITALLGEMESFPGAAGAMEAQSQTLAGAMSNFFDTISTSLADAFTPIIPTITEAIQGVLPVISDALAIIVPPLTDLVTALLPVLAANIEPVAQILATFFTILAESVPIIAPLIPDLLDALLNAFVQLAPVMPDLVQAFVQLTQATLPLMIALTPVLVKLIEGLTWVVYGTAAAFETMTAAASWLWHDVLVPFGGFLRGAYVSTLNFVKTAWEGVYDAVQTVTGALRIVWNNVFMPFVNFMRDTVGPVLAGVATGFEAAGGAVGGVTGAVRGLIGVVRDAIDWVGDLIDKITDIPSIPSIGGGGIPLVPFLASGGFVRSPTLAVVGEAGPELVLPLGDRRRSLDLLAASGLFDTLGGAASGARVQASGGGVNNTVNVYVTAAPGATDRDARLVGDAVASAVTATLNTHRVRMEARIA